MSSPSPAYAIRIAATAGLNAYLELVPAVATAGAEIAALDVVESTHKNVVVAITS
jgi:malate dehydrogenase (oxaloacetate-decarboxylating)